jgi:probable rRNA maturation factor
MSTESPNVDDPDPSGSLAIEVSDTQSHLRIDREALARLAATTLGAEGVQSASLSIALVDDATIRKINRDHLGHDWPTDVISFGLSHSGDRTLAGELVVSAEMAATTARRVGVEAWHELALYVVHGLLHLCGYDDSEPAPRAQMRRREGELLAVAGLLNTFDAIVAVAEEEEPDDAVGTPTEVAPWTS